MDSTEPADAAAPSEAMLRLARLETIYELAPVGIGLVDLDGRTTMTNSVLRTLLGYTPEEFAARPFSEFTHPDDVAANLALFGQLVAGTIDRFAMEKRFIRKDGELLWADLTVSLVTDLNGEPDYAIGMTLDSTARKRLEHELRAAEQRYRLLVERVPAVVYVAAPGQAGQWSFVSPQIERMLGYSAQEWLADPALWFDRLHPDDREPALAGKQKMLSSGVEGEPCSDTYRLVHRDGSTVWVRDDSMVLRDPSGLATFQGVLVNVTPERDLSDRLGHQAFHDQLTHLPNRGLFRDRVGQALARSHRRPGLVVVLFIDLDNFKAINDTFGHACGDEVIIAAARRIARCSRAEDTAARLGGDEFGLLMEGVTLEQATEIADRVLDALHDRPVDFSDRTVTVGASVGIAVAEEGETTDMLLRNADLAMYQAKQRGRGRHVVYDPSMHLAAVTRFRLEASLQRAVATGSIAVAYQPIVDLRTGEVAGLEALARWSDPELGDVPPAQFIPVAEQTGLMQHLGRLVLDRACGDLVRWRAATGSAAYVSVNVSARQLDDQPFPALVRSVLAVHALEPAALVLEVSEALLLAEGSCRALDELRAIGVRVAIDDFGAGFASLSYLRQLPVDLVKIDQAIVRSAESGAHDVAFLRAVIGLAQTLELVTIGEGIETVDQLVDLRETTCAFGQGYLLARPGPIMAIPAMIDSLRRVP